MDLFAVLNTLKTLIFSIPVNFFDVILIAAFIFYVYEEASLGALAAFSNLVTITISFFGGLAFYQYFSNILINLFAISKGISDAVSFVVLCGVLYLVTSNIIAYFTRKSSLLFPNKYSKITGGLLGAISFTLISAFIVSVLLSFPLSTVIKSQVRNSLSGRFLFTKILSLEFATRQVFGGAISDTLNFMTIKPDADTSITLHFKTNNGTVDTQSENEMLALVNQERKKNGVEPLITSDALTKVARAHAQDMLERGYFSHYTPEGLSPFDRLEKASIPYNTAAENLAFAPEVDIAMTGLMKSDGHRKNILDPAFHNIGIGVIDAGIYGKMFVQEFTD